MSRKRIGALIMNITLEAIIAMIALAAALPSTILILWKCIKEYLPSNSIAPCDIPAPTGDVECDLFVALFTCTSEQTQKLKNRADRTSRTIGGDLKAVDEVFRNEALLDALRPDIEKFRQLLLELAVWSCRLCSGFPARKSQIRQRIGLRPGSEGWIVQ